MEKKWDEVYEERKKGGREVVQPQVLSMASEPEYEYGAEVFEAYMKENKGEVKSDIKEVVVQKN